MRQTLLVLFSRLEGLVNSSNMVTAAHVREKTKYSLVDVAPCLSDGERTPPHQVSTGKIFLSPTNSGKRTRAVFEENDSR